jgi:gamma-glutamyltranspeptidase/glutathione hydrolase
MFLASLSAASAAKLASAQSPGAKVDGGPPARPDGAWRAGDDQFIRSDVHAGDRPVGASFSSRTAVYGLNGAAGTAHPLATQVGIDILKAGGSAVDAAIAINACLGFLEPTSSGVGGDCYAMIWAPRSGKLQALPDRARARMP